MANEEVELSGLRDTTIGILGAGHLGRCLALELRKRGAARLMLAHGGSAHTREELERSGLGALVREPAELVQESRICLLALRPQQARGLAALPFREGAVLVSLMAGVSINSIEGLTRRRVERLLPSGPDSIRAGDAVAAAYPAGGTAEALGRFLGLRVFPLGAEAELVPFTASVCLSAALIELEARGHDTAQAAQELKANQPRFGEVVDWALRVVEQTANLDEKAAYRDRMMTSGGVTEAVVDAVRAGKGLHEAFDAGAARCTELAAAAARRDGGMNN